MVRQLTGRELEKVYCDLAGTIKDKLREFWHRRPRVYVVQPDLDDAQAEDAWRDIRAKLRAAGYAVTPKGPLIGRTGDMVLRDELQQAQIAVRLASLRESELAHRQVAIIGALGKSMVTGDPQTRQWSDGLLREVKALCERLRAPFLCLVCERYRDGQRAAQLQSALRGATSLEVAVDRKREVRPTCWRSCAARRRFCCSTRMLPVSGTRDKWRSWNVPGRRAKG